MATQDQAAIFQARVKNITDPKNTYYLDAETGMKIPKRVGRDQILANGKTPPATVTSMITAVILGVLCLIVARYLQIVFLDINPSVPNALAVELAMSGVMAFTIGGFVRQKMFKHLVSHMAGAVLAAMTMHNAVWIAPDQFAFVFSQDFVDQILAATNPMSLNIAGNSFTI
ncbi:MAG: hypothetical protein ACI9ND_001778 [Yoonia sp.]|jgi:hypothetical protein